MQKYIVDDLETLVEALPPHIQAPLRERGDMSELLEVVLDLGTSPGGQVPRPGRPVLVVTGGHGGGHPARSGEDRSLWR